MLYTPFYYVGSLFVGNQKTKSLRPFLSSETSSSQSLWRSISQSP